ncbi:2'-5' RNA ligase family protein [Neobacillus niacini]|uniref:2'-5' RNA ligase family protein n=1 Tax=Neobacillus niacini TaxID=86668 RepID=UPI003B01A54A
MQYFIGIVPSDDYKSKVLKFQKHWTNNSLPDVVEPHITIKAQGGLTPEKDWLKKVENVCKTTLPFKVKINKPAFFGVSVLFLSVESNEIFELHRKIVNEVSPEKYLIKKYMELDDYVPHLTLGQTHWGLSSEELKEMAQFSDEQLSPYPSFEVDFLRVYQEIQPNKYRKYIDIPLAN